MNHERLYTALFEQALGKIRLFRKPTEDNPALRDQNWLTVSEQIMFDFTDIDTKKMLELSSLANDITFSCLKFIFTKLLEDYGYKPSEVFYTKTGMLETCKFALIDTNSKTLLLFKEIEKSLFFALKEQHPSEIIDLMKTSECTKCLYIYFVYDKAYLLNLSYNNKLDDRNEFPYRSIREFFESYFSEDEYITFRRNFEEYINQANEYIGYTTIKTLTPYAALNFKRIIENELQFFPYDVLISSNVNGYILDQDTYDKLHDQFTKKDYYKALVSDSAYAESYITAEWLYMSMKKARAIDLTIIGTGYFKAVEQLLYEIMCLYKDNGIMVRKNPQKNTLPEQVELNSENLSEGNIDTTIGSMANFFKNNATVVFRRDIKYKGKKYIREAIFEYKDFRNGYFHKDNIHSWEIIEEIRKKTHELLFLVLGSIYNSLDSICSENDLKALSDYDRLCEYVNLHEGTLFLIEDTYSKNEALLVGVGDPAAKIVDKKVCYSGLYFKGAGPAGKIGSYQENELKGFMISSVELLYKYDHSTNEIKLDMGGKKLIYDKGHFVGPVMSKEFKKY